jgi:hypothetical protein
LTALAPDLAELEGEALEEPEAAALPEAADPEPDGEEPEAAALPDEAPAVEPAAEPEDVELEELEPPEPDLIVKKPL